MTSLPISLAVPADLPRLFDVWHLSVRATHDFLADSDIAFLMPFVRADDGVACAFLCVEHAKIEMLFVHPERRGSGAGRTLLRHAIDTLGATAVDVNEHNTQAHGFYRHQGFILENRSERDPFGQPFPILHLKLAENG